MKNQGANHVAFLHLEGLIQKGKKYLQPGQTAPKGVHVHTGPQGGKYYLTEDKHLKIGDKYHELVRSKGVTRDQWTDIEKTYRALGALSVEFINKPNNAKNEQGKPIYNIYVSWPSSELRIAKKQHADKKRYGHPRINDDDIRSGSLWTVRSDVHSHPVFDHRGGKRIRNGQYEIHHSGQFGAKLFHVDRSGKKHKLAVSYVPVFGEASETDIDEHKSREKNISLLKLQILTLNPSLRRFLAAEMKRHDEERAANPPKKPKVSKNPTFELHQALREIRESKKKSIPASGYFRSSFAMPVTTARKMTDSLTNQGYQVHLEDDQPWKGVKQYRVVWWKEQHPKENPPLVLPLSQAIGESEKEPAGVNGLTLMIPHDRSMKQAWMAKYTTINRESAEAMYGTTLLQHRREDENVREFGFPGDGLYQAQGSGEPGRRYYRVAGGKVRQITLPEWEKTAREILPFEPLQDILDRMKKKTPKSTQLVRTGIHTSTGSRAIAVSSP